MQHTGIKSINASNSPARNSQTSHTYSPRKDGMNLTLVDSRVQGEKTPSPSYTHASPATSFALQEEFSTYGKEADFKTMYNNATTDYSDLNTVGTPAPLMANKLLSPFNMALGGSSLFRQNQPYRQSPQMEVGTAAAAREQKVEVDAAYAMNLQTFLNASSGDESTFDTTSQSYRTDRTNSFFSTAPKDLSSMSSTSDQTNNYHKKPADSNANTGAYTCTFDGCTQRFETLIRLQNHKTAHAKTSSQTKSRKCEQTNPSTGRPCNKFFSRPYDLTRHEESVHDTSKRKLRCALCTEERKFSRNDALRRHIVRTLEFSISAALLTFDSALYTLRAFRRKNRSVGAFQDVHGRDGAG